MKALLLDWSGTIVDDFTPTVYATNQVFKEYGLPEWSADEFRKKFYLPYPKFYEEVLPDVPLLELEVIFRQTFVECPQPVTLLPNSLEFLNWAHSAGIKLIILSSMDTNNFEEQARRFGVYDLFEAVYAGVLNKCETIPEILKAHELEASQTAFVGDMEHDIEAAHSVGVHSVAVLTGYDPVERLVEKDPGVILTHIGKLRAVIEGCQERK